MDLLFSWIVAIHYNAFITIRDFLISQLAIIIGAIGWIWMAKFIYEDKERLARPKRRWV